MEVYRVLSLLLLCLLLRVNTALDLPNLGDVFNNLMRAQTDDINTESDDAVHSRSKRQNPGIGDESQYHYEAKSTQ
jgi:hypothetical protein